MIPKTYSMWDKIKDSMVWKSLSKYLEQSQYIHLTSKRNCICYQQLHPSLNTNALAEVGGHLSSNFEKLKSVPIDVPVSTVPIWTSPWRTAAESDWSWQQPSVVGSVRSLAWVSARKIDKKCWWPGAPSTCCDARESPRALAADSHFRGVSRWGKMLPKWKWMLCKYRDTSHTEKSSVSHKGGTGLEENCWEMEGFSDSILGEFWHQFKHYSIAIDVWENETYLKQDIFNN